MTCTDPSLWVAGLGSSKLAEVSFPSSLLFSSSVHLSWQFHAMDTLQRNGYDLAKAMSTLVPQGGPVLCRDEMEEWSASEAMLFEEALEKYGKDFNDIRQDFVSCGCSLGGASSSVEFPSRLSNLTSSWASWELGCKTSDSSVGAPSQKWNCWGCAFEVLRFVLFFAMPDLDGLKLCMLLTVCVPCSCRGNPWPASCSSTTCGKLRTDTSSRWVGQFLR